ncbi:hypothetical protein F4861DRAFT_531328 [Xylaria intraflava]|nr:hypothetical protein F4861DRAFT_531328 [Xylaria intraflava]
MSSPQVRCLIDAGFQSQIILPSDEKYTQRENTYWSASTRLEPACIVQPKSAEDVADILKAVIAAQQKFAVRSGGHGSAPGASNIEDGVTIDLGELNTVSYDEASGRARLGPGAKWHEVYKYLSQYGRTIAGGRVGDVGVGGLLLGGGKTYFSARYGFACDSVVSYDIVLASGEIATVTKDEHEELFRALKGGSNNFGIVTSFEMDTFPCGPLWGGMMLLAPETIPTVISAMASFTDNIASDPDASVICLFTHSPDTQGTGAVAYVVHTAGVADAPAFREFAAIPQIANTMKMSSHHELAVEFGLPGGYYNVWYTITIKNTTRMMQEATRHHENLIQTLKTQIPSGDFITQCVFQSLPTLYAEQAEAAGGNIMGVERHTENGILLLAAAMLRTKEQASAAEPLIRAWCDALAADVDGVLPWVDLNYANAAQSPLASYGREAVDRMRRVAAQYDPQGVFQTLCPGGFKISSVRDEDIRD